MRLLPLLLRLLLLAAIWSIKTADERGFYYRSSAQYSYSRAPYTDPSNGAISHEIQ